MPIKKSAGLPLRLPTLEKRMRGGLFFGINARYAQRYAAEQLVGDRPGERGKLCDRRRAVVPAAEHRNDVAHGGVGDVGHVEHAHVHADAPDLLYARPAQPHLKRSG